MSEKEIVHWLGDVNYQGMLLINEYWWLSWAVLFFLGGLIGMSPLKTHHTHSFFEISGVCIRKGILIISLPLVCAPQITAYFYSVTSAEVQPEQAYLTWFLTLLKQNWWVPIATYSFGLLLRFLFNRYCMTLLSSLFRKLTKKQTNDNPSDIKKEQSKYKAKKYDPEKYYSEKGMFVGL